MPNDDLTPEDEQVRRLLADARHTEPMPADVAERLDGVLAGLRDEAGDDPVVRPLRTWPSAAEVAARERRRRVRNWLVAAAAVVVVGVGINQVDWSGVTMSADDADSGGGDAMSAAEPEAAGSGAAEDSAGRDARVWQRARAELDGGRFPSQVRMLRSVMPGAMSVTSSDAEVDTADPTAGSLDGQGFATPLCGAGHLGPGRVVSVRYDGERAWLVFRAPEGDSQVVDLYLCGSDEPTRSIRLPVP